MVMPRRVLVPLKQRFMAGLKLSEALSLNVEHVDRAKVELKVKGWTKNRPPRRRGGSQSQGGEEGQT